MSALAKYPEKKEATFQADDRDLLLEIRTRRDEAHEADEDNCNASKHDLKFLAGDQWPDGIKQEREQLIALIELAKSQLWQDPPE